MPFLFVKSVRWLLMQRPAVRWVFLLSPSPSSVSVVLASSRSTPSVASASTWVKDLVSPPPSPPANFSRGVQCAFGEVMRPFGFTTSHLSPLMLTVLIIYFFIFLFLLFLNIYHFSLFSVLFINFISVNVFIYFIILIIHLSISCTVYRLILVKKSIKKNIILYARCNYERVVVRLLYMIPRF